MTPYTHQRQPVGTSDTRADWGAPAQSDQRARASVPMSHQAEQAARSVMHPDHHDPDWRYYFGAMAS